MRMSGPLFVFLVCCASCTRAGTNNSDAVDPDLAREIAATKAIDNHAHPVRPTAPGEQPDMEFDALPVDNLVPQSDPERQRPKSPTVIRAGTELFAGDKAGVR